MNETNRSSEEDSRYVTFRRSDFNEPAKIRITTRPPKPVSRDTNPYQPPKLSKRDRRIMMGWDDA